MVLREGNRYIATTLRCEFQAFDARTRRPAEGSLMAHAASAATLRDTRLEHSSR
jgi:hypothetical protein